MNYDKMTNEEINLAVANLLPDEIFCNDKGVPVRLEPNEAPAYTGTDFDEIIFEPCNSWSDAGPIISANRISLIHYFSLGDTWIAEFLGSAEHRKVESLQHSDKNPLRAAMIVFLMSKEVE